MDWAQVLVIILSVVLLVFLILAIYLVALLIKVGQQIKTITDVAERTAVKLESAAGSMFKVASPIAVIKLVSAMLKNKK